MLNISESDLHLLRGSTAFDPDWYAQQYQDVTFGKFDPTYHFLWIGWKLGRKPSEKISFDFDQQEYVRRNPKVVELGIHPVAHYLAYGIKQVEEARSLPQGLEYYLSERYSDSVIRSTSYIFSIIDKYADHPAAFDESDECRRIVGRIKNLSNQKEWTSPTASIIIPAYNNLVYTLTCILSILEIDDLTSYEIIVADDCSSDATPSVIPRLGANIRLARQSENRGFLQNCNDAAQSVDGDIIVLLNNDTIVLAGWLDALMAPFAADELVGLVGSKLLNSDGTLQEAGGIFWSDGSAWNFGRNQDPRLPAYNYLKDVDYCSGASIALHRSVWKKLGGFDPFYNPAYCEDADLAFRVRADGKRTVYAPHSELIHHEGRSHGRDITTGIKAYQVVNQQKLFERWRATLQADHFPNGDEVLLARDRSRDKRRILIVDHYVPQWDRDAGSRSIHHFIKILLAAGFHVTFWPDNLNEDPEYARPLQAMGVEVIYSHHFVGKFDDWLAENGANLDYAMLCRPHVAEPYLDALQSYSNITKIYYGVDLHFLRIRQQMLSVGYSPELQQDIDFWEARERALCQRCDAIFYPGHEEVEVVKGWVSPSVPVLAFSITVFTKEEINLGRKRASDNQADLYRLMFVGGFSHTPNLDSIVWFIREVMPILVARDSRYTLTIAGSNAPQAIIDMAQGAVKFLGRISDEELAVLYDESGIAIVPLLYGGGVKGKVIEAMSKGVPVAMTSVGAQGISGADKLSFIGNGKDELAEQILAMRLDRGKTKTRSLAALDFIEANYSIEAVRRNLSQVLPELSQSVQTPAT